MFLKIDVISEQLGEQYITEIFESVPTNELMYGEQNKLSKYSFSRVANF